jgi:hypothetical protein
MGWIRKRKTGRLRDGHRRTKAPKPQRGAPKHAQIGFGERGISFVTGHGGRFVSMI